MSNIQHKYEPSYTMNKQSNKHVNAGKRYLSIKLQFIFTQGELIPNISG